jgi:hypothetical protein
VFITPGQLDASQLTALARSGWSVIASIEPDRSAGRWVWTHSVARQADQKAKRGRPWKNDPMAKMIASGVVMADEEELATGKEQRA